MLMQTDILSDKHEYCWSIPGIPPLPPGCMNVMLGVHIYCFLLPYRMRGVCICELLMILSWAGTVSRTRLAIATKEIVAAHSAEASTDLAAAELQPTHGRVEARSREQEQNRAWQSEQTHQQEAQAASEAADVTQPVKGQPAADDADIGAQAARQSAARQSAGADLPAQPQGNQELGESSEGEADEPAAVPQHATEPAELAGAAISLGADRTDNDDEDIEVDVDKEDYQEAEDIFETPAHQPRFMTPGSSFGTARQQPTAYKTGQEHLTGISMHSVQPHRWACAGRRNGHSASKCAHRHGITAEGHEAAQGDTLPDAPLNHVWYVDKTYLQHPALC